MPLRKHLAFSLRQQAFKGVKGVRRESSAFHGLKGIFKGQISLKALKRLESPYKSPQGPSISFNAFKTASVGFQGRYEAL